MSQFVFYELSIFDDDKLKIVLVVTRYQDKWVFCRHKQRSTWEIPGGHREEGETIEAAARRELWEETGAMDFTIEPVVVCCDEKLCGMVYFAQVRRFEAIPQSSEMEEVQFYKDIPENLTYPALYSVLFAYILKAYLD